MHLHRVVAPLRPRTIYVTPTHPISAIPLRVQRMAFGEDLLFHLVMFFHPFSKEPS